MCRTEVWRAIDPSRIPGWVSCARGTEVQARKSIEPGESLGALISNTSTMRTALGAKRSSTV